MSKKLFFFICFGLINFNIYSMLVRLGKNTKHFRPLIRLQSTKKNKGYMRQFSQGQFFQKNKKKEKLNLFDQNLKQAFSENNSHLFKIIKKHKDFNVNKAFRFLPLNNEFNVYFVAYFMKHIDEITEDAIEKLTEKNNPGNSHLDKKILRLIFDLKKKGII